MHVAEHGQGHKKCSGQGSFGCCISLTIASLWLHLIGVVFSCLESTYLKYCNLIS